MIALDFNAGRDRASDNLDHALGALISELSRGNIDQEEITNLLAEITSFSAMRTGVITLAEIAETLTPMPRH